MICYSLRIAVGLSFLALMTSVMSTNPTFAVVFNWDNSVGGAFDTDFNWDRGSVPGIGDDAVFGLDADYTVTFFRDEATDGLRLENNSDVTFDLAGETYTVDSITFGTGDALGDSNQLLILDGTLRLSSSISGVMDVGASNALSQIVVSGEDALWFTESDSEAFRIHFGRGEGSDLLSFVEGGTGIFNTWTVLGNDRSNFVGQVEVIGNGSLWEVNNELEVRATGSVSLREGGTLTHDDSQVVIDGSFLVDGINFDGDSAAFESTGDIVVGGAYSDLALQTPELRIINGGTATSSRGLVGSSSRGTVRVGGPEASWEISEDLQVGILADGSLDITLAGSVTASSSIIGGFFTSEGEVTVDGEGSIWNAGELQVGQHGVGRLDVIAGATGREWDYQHEHHGNCY